jgi:C4-type Zn-finger protein
MSLVFYFNDPCPKCRQPRVNAIIEKHPSRKDLAVQNYYCVDCGPLKTKTISLNRNNPPAGLAA